MKDISGKGYVFSPEAGPGLQYMIPLLYSHLGQICNTMKLITLQNSLCILNTKGSCGSSYLVGLTPGLARDGKVRERKAFSPIAQY